MKGLAIRTVMLLVIAVIVMAVALYFLVYLTNFDFLFVSNDQRILEQYSTCVLAYCADGAGSDQVNAVGCLESKDGKCALSCNQVEDIFKEKGVSFFSRDGRNHYCGNDASLTFEFAGTSLNGKVPLQSGEMTNIEKQPGWVCKPYNIPFTNIDIDSLLIKAPGGFGLFLAQLDTADIQYNGGSPLLPNMGFPKNCIMLSKAVTDSRVYGDLALFAINFIPGLGEGEAAFQAEKASLESASLSAQVVSPAFPGSVAQGLSVSEKGLAYVGGLRAGANALSQSSKVATVTGLASSFVGDQASLTDPQQSLGFATKGGCFTGYVYDNLNDNNPPRDDILYTPIIQYNKLSDRIYPSAIYVDPSFTQPGGDCTYMNPVVAAKRNKGETEAAIDAEREDIAKKYVADHANDAVYQNPKDANGKDISDSGTKRLLSDAESASEAQIPTDPIVGLDVFGVNTGLPTYIPSGFYFGNMVKSCNFDVTSNGEKIQYTVWANPTFPGIGSMKNFGSFLNPSADSDPQQATQDQRTQNVIQGISSYTGGGTSDSSSVITNSVDQYGAFEGYVAASDQVGQKNLDSYIQELTANLTRENKTLESMKGDGKSTPDQIQAQQSLVDGLASKLAAAQTTQKNQQDAAAAASKEGTDPVADSFAQFGSCAYVTLSRTLPSSPLSTPGTSGGTQDLVRDIAALSTDKTSYALGDTIQVTGKLDMASGSPANRGVLVELYDMGTTGIGPPLLEHSETVDTDADGGFKLSYSTADGGSGGSWYATASYQTEKQRVDFTVS